MNILIIKKVCIKLLEVFFYTAACKVRSGQPELQVLQQIKQIVFGFFPWVEAEWNESGEAMIYLESKSLPCRFMLENGKSHAASLLSARADVLKFAIKQHNSYKILLHMCAPFVLAVRNSKGSGYLVSIEESSGYYFGYKFTSRAHP